MNEQLAASMFAIAGLVVFILAASVAFDRKLALVEYRWTRTRCPACGRSCFGRRQRARIKDSWEPWQSECCNEPLE